MQEHDDLTLVADGIDFGEGPRWHDGRLWYSDFYQHRICSIGVDDDRRIEFEDLADQPSGLGWLPDGSLLVVFMQTRIVVREENGMLVTHADISHLTKFMANDMVVHENGNAYVGNFGFDFAHGEAYQPADLVLVRPDGSAETAAKDLAFPNGCVITPDGGTLIVGETFGSGYQAFTINADGTLSDKRQWAKVDGTFPDGCALDDDGGIWFADALGGQVFASSKAVKSPTGWPPHRVRLLACSVAPTGTRCTSSAPRSDACRRRRQGRRNYPRSPRPAPARWQTLSITNRPARPLQTSLVS